MILDVPAAATEAAVQIWRRKDHIPQIVCTNMPDYTVYKTTGPRYEPLPWHYIRQVARWLKKNEGGAEAGRFREETLQLHDQHRDGHPQLNDPNMTLLCASDSDAAIKKNRRSSLNAVWINYENNQQDALYRLSYYSKSALHVSGDVFAHHQEHLTVFTVSGIVHPSCCRLPAGSHLGEHYQIL
jgi:hypothetical protein